jgi:Family of unknown function (DUF6444)/Transposase IS66 family
MIEELLKENQTLKEALKVALARNAQLEERLKLNSKNSSKPPSSDQKRNSQNLPKNKGGGQKGHPPHLRKRFEEQDIQNTHICAAQTCARCGSSLITLTTTTSCLDQVELEKRKINITRYQRPVYRCTACKKSFAAPLPKGISHRCFGPRFEAMVSVMTGEYHLSKRQASKILKDIFDITLSASTVSNIQKRTHQVLEDEGEIGRELVFHLREVFKILKSNLTKEKHQSIQYRRRCIKRLLEEGLYDKESPQFVRFCIRLLDDYDRLWTFLWHPELDCHNNRAERDLRSLVLWRKKSFGTQSHIGQEFVERISSVCGTLKKRGQTILQFLSKSFCASLFDESFPSPLAY